MKFVIVDRKINSRLDGHLDGSWCGQGLFYALGKVYLKAEDGRIFDLDGRQVFLPNDTIVCPMKLAWE